MPQPKYLMNKAIIFGESDGKEKDEIIAIDYDGKAFY
jgi:hypothetical protein